MLKNVQEKAAQFVQNVSCVLNLTAFLPLRTNLV